jgi:GTP-binding protein
LKIIAVEFVTSAAALRLEADGSPTLAQGRPVMAGIPRDGLPQVAMTGRSNVGKSTLINALLRRQVARTSAAAGKTRLANVFRVTVEGYGPGRWSLYLVDLPGYGYARGGTDSAVELAAVAEAYFSSVSGVRYPVIGAEEAPLNVERRVPNTENRGPNLTLLLVDSRHPGLDSDTQAYRWLEALGVEPLIVATKIDKLSRAVRTRNLRELEKTFGKPALPVSAERGEGLDELWTTIAKMGKAARTRAARDDE